MENRNLRSSERFSKSDPKLRIHRFAGERRGQPQPPRGDIPVGVKRPRVSIVMADGRTHFSAGDVLVCEYSIQIHPDDRVTAVESSVIWHTDGKGEEDLGVHFFQRR
jgi:hypothetical protein